MSALPPRHYVLDPQSLIDGNDVEILRDGAEAFPAMLEAIAGAVRSVRLEIYTFAHDETGRRFSQAMTEAARRGLEVTLLYDAVGCWSTSRAFFRGLAATGVHVHAHRPIGWFGLRRLFHLRDHRKLLVLDGSIAFVGGINIADSWAPSPRDRGFRDLMLRIEGPAAGRLESVFRSAWRAHGRGQSRLGRRDRPMVRGNVALAVVAARRKIHEAYLHAIEQAERSILIAAGYFVPDPTLLAAIQGARARGVEVTLLLSGISDHPIIQAAGRARYDLLLSWGVRIFERLGTMLHAKSAIVDNAWATVGSFNLDSLSRLHNHELNVLVADPAFAARLRDRLFGEVGEAVEVEAGRWRARPWHRKLNEWVGHSLRAWL